jgi:isopenicillin-N epimerase
VTSHGANADASRRPRFRLEFDWVGTDDPTPFLCVPEAIRFVGSLLDGGWPAVRDHNRALAFEARSLLCEALDVAPPCPEEMVGSLAAVPLPPADARASATPLHSDPLAEELFGKHRIEVLVVRWPAPPRRLVRISAQLYNRRDQYQRLAGALKEMLAADA